MFGKDLRGAILQTRMGVCALLFDGGDRELVPLGLVQGDLLRIVPNGDLRARDYHTFYRVPIEGSDGEGPVVMS